jgi:galactokinase
MIMDLSQPVWQSFVECFGDSPEFVVRAPGRVNLIGEHTDYNDGFCLPLAIDRALWIALRPRQDKVVQVQSLDFAETIAFDLHMLTRSQEGWSPYVVGVAWALQQNGYALSGWEGVMRGNVPIGSGLSSSAALEMAVARAFAAVSGFPWEAARMAQIGQQTENEWLNLQTGIMDQLISAAGVAGHALLMDCRSLSLTPVPLPEGTTVIIMDTKTPRGLVDSAYNERRAECERAAQLLGVPALRDVSRADFEYHAGRLDPLIRQRARHVISENERTLLAAQAMREGNGRRLGDLMNASHDSLRDDYEVSSATLNVMVEIARQQEGCLGARMTGGGFGGCAIALVKEQQTETFITRVFQAYQMRTQLTPDIYGCQPSPGASLVELSQLLTNKKFDII